MGWLFTKKSKQQLVDTLVQPSSNENVSNEVLDYHLVGSVLWSLVRLTVKKEGLGRSSRASPWSLSDAIC